MHLPRVRATVIFLDESSGGRQTMPHLSSGSYMPHIVVESPDVREVKREGECVVEDYLGIRFLSGPEQPVAQHPAECVFELMYHPRVDYNAVCIGATFTLREGGKIVGFGTVAERID